MSEISEFMKARDEAFERDDVAWGARFFNKNPNKPSVIIGFHRARIEAVAVSELKRRESLSWLAARGLNKFDGTPAHPDDPLPYRIGMKGI